MTSTQPTFSTFIVEPKMIGRCPSWLVLAPLTLTWLLTFCCIWFSDCTLTIWLPSMTVCGCDVIVWFIMFTLPFRKTIRYWQLNEFQWICDVTCVKIFPWTFSCCPCELRMNVPLGELLACRTRPWPPALVVPPPAFVLLAMMRGFPPMLAM